MRRTVLAALLGASALPATTLAQSECTVSKSSNEAKMLAWFAGPLAFAQLGPPQRLPIGAVVIGGDLTWVPTPASGVSQSSAACYTLKKSEHTGLSPVLPRPRILVGLGGGLTFEAMYLPPVTVADATPNMGSVALGWVTPLGGATVGPMLTVRAHATFGQVQGPITCSKDALQQSSFLQACWGSTPSKDTYRPNVMGVEAGLATAGTGRLNWYGGVGYASLTPRFQVGFTLQDGNVDHTKLRVDLTRLSAFGGLGYKVSDTVELTAQLYSVPDDATTARAGLSWRLR
ncbi:MAG: hypothetical protein ACHQQ3_07355 [Gemmatimonadales bacterium]